MSDLPAPLTDSDVLYDEYLRTLGEAQRSCNPIDWARTGSAWAAWLAQYKRDNRHILVAAAIAEQQYHVIDLSRII